VLARGVGGSPFANRDLAMRPVTNQGQILLPLTADDGCVESALTGPYPTLRVVGLEPADPPRREAIAKIETADYSDRIEIRDQPVEALTDVEGFDLVYLPQVFLSEDAPFHLNSARAARFHPPAASSLSVDLSRFRAPDRAHPDGAAIPVRARRANRHRALWDTACRG
jgi:hypothetical protein